MDTAALAAALLGAQTAERQFALAATIIKMNAAADASVVTLIQSAQQNVDRLANVASGVGGNLDISA